MGGRDSVLEEAGLAARFETRIRFLATRQLGDAELADDVVQETLTRVLFALRNERVQQLESLPGYVLQTARHVCLQKIRSLQRERRALGGLQRQGSSQQGADALTGLITAERAAVVRDALEQLPGEDYDLLRRVYYDGDANDDIARDLAITTGALRVRKHRALRRLRELIEGIGSPDRGASTAGNDPHSAGTSRT